MAKINKIQTDISLLNKELGELNDKLVEQNNKIAVLRGQLDAFDRSPKNTKAAEKRVKSLLDAALKVQGSLNERYEITNKRYNDYFDRKLFDKLLTPQQRVAELADDYPILLFPVRLETRFKSTGGKPQLWVRVYPDDCNVVKREILISKQEIENTRNFWVEMTKASGEETLERGAWKVLVNNHGSGRAAWLIQHYKPIDELAKSADRSDVVLVIVNEDGTLKALDKLTERYWMQYWLLGEDPDGQEKLLAKTAQEGGLSREEMTKKLAEYRPVNIDEKIAGDRRTKSIEVRVLNLPDKSSLSVGEQSWNSAPEAICMPDKFVAVTYLGSSSKSHVFSKSVSKTLHTGIDPTKVNDVSKNEELDIALYPELAWMTDFERAVDAGMAIKIDLDSKEAANGFDRLLVVGVRISSDVNSSKQELENLIRLHGWSDEGFAFLKQGTPTNNTEGDDAGFSTLEDADESYDRLFKNKSSFALADSLDKQTDGQRFAHYLGIDPAILQTIDQANGTDGLEAMAMNKALFPATMGYFMDEMLDTLFSDQSVESTKDFFARHVSGRGPLPAYRIGKQPYGILPTTAYSKLKFNDRASKRIVLKNNRFLMELQELINKLDSVWDTQVPKVAYIGKPGNDQQTMLDVLGLHPNSVEFRQRYSDGIGPMYNVLAMQTMNPEMANTFFSYVLQESEELMAKIGVSQSGKIPSIFEKYFRPQSNLLNGPLVDDVPASESAAIRAYSSNNKNYIQWLVDSSAETIRQHKFGTGRPRPKAILYLLLRHALMLAQSTSATNLLINNKVIKNKSQVQDTEYINVKATSSNQFNKFQVLFDTNSRIPNLNGVTVAEYLYHSDVFRNYLETKSLRETVDAMRMLQDLPTARLERLLIEHLDCCNYRLDAWKTGLVDAKFNQQIRSKNKQGLYMGAYGVLLDLRPKPKALKTYSINRQAYRSNKMVNMTYQEDPTNLGYIHAPSMDQAVTAAVLRNAYDAFPDKTKPNPYAINLNSERVRLARNVLDGLRNGQSLAALLGYQFERGLHDLYSSTGIEADKYVYPLRLVFPLQSNKMPDTKESDADVAKTIDEGRSMESIQAQNVIDGLRLIQHYQQASNKNYPFGLDSFKLPAANAAQGQAIKKEIERVADIYDAIADMVVSESMYQVVKGNYERAAAITNAFSKGGFPPELEFVNTPRSGTTITHKIAIHFDHMASAVVSPNSLNLMTPRARFEAGVNSWLSALLPDPASVICRVRCRDTGNGDLNITVSQSDIGLQPIDLLYSANFDSDQSMTELDDRIVAFVKYKQQNGMVTMSPFTQVDIVYDVAKEELGDGEVSFFALAGILKSLRHILLGDKVIKPEDVHMAGQTAAPKAYYDIDGLRQKLANMEEVLQEQKTQVDAIQQDMYTISAVIADFRQVLTGLALTPAAINDAILLLDADIRREYIFNVAATTVGDELTLFLENMTLDQGQISALIQQIGIWKGRYMASLVTLDDWIKRCVVEFNACALIDSAQTGTGFIHDALLHMKGQVADQIAAFLMRWDEKWDKYKVLESTWDSLVDEGKLLTMLQQAEAMLCSSCTIPVPVDSADYKRIVKDKAEIFKAKLEELRTIASDDFLSVRDFVRTVEMALATLDRFELLAFDGESDSNIPVQLKKNTLQLHEDIGQAVSNISNYMAAKLVDYNEKVGQPGSAASNTELKDHYVAVAKRMVMADTLVLPRLIMDEDLRADFEDAYKQKEAILEFGRKYDDRLFPVEDWFAGLARVRKNVWNMENIMSLSQGFKPNEFIDFLPLQFPVKANNRWLAMKYIKDKDVVDYKEEEERLFMDIREDNLLYTSCFATAYSADQFVYGILLDSWTESVPLKNETTGIAFHYDQPNSEPPQTMLLMVSPELTGKWNWENIVSGINETLELAKQRAVEPSMLATTPYAQLLPTTMVAVTTNMLTVATNLAANISEINAKQ